MIASLFADTNLLIYTLDPADPVKQARAFAIVEQGVASGRLVTSPQSLNECYQVMAMKRRLAIPETARSFVASLFPTCRAEMNLETIALAWEIEAETRFGWWDSLLVASAVRHGCTHFLTEDLSDGRRVRGMTLLNPFTNDVSSLLS
ncbi:MAG: PIN domain-containing protein [Bauldia sp.]|nr:PIN domain-containing protein [Bauldia sp.]